MKSALWLSPEVGDWYAAFASYASVIARQGVERLPALDAWFTDDFSHAIAARATPHITRDELVQLTEWKMARGVWRAPNLVFVKSNLPDVVERISTAAFATLPHPTAPVATLAELKGVGPATASAAASAFAPQHYPFFDEIVAAQITELGAVAWTLGYYGRYAARLRERATLLGAAWTPMMVERALWSNAGGKAGHA